MRICCMQSSAPCVAPCGILDSDLGRAGYCLLERAAMHTLYITCQAIVVQSSLLLPYAYRILAQLVLMIILQAAM